MPNSEHRMLPPPPPPPPPPPLRDHSASAAQEEEEVEVRYVQRRNGTNDINANRAWSLRSAKRPSPTSVIWSDLDGGRFDDTNTKNCKNCMSGDELDGNDSDSSGGDDGMCGRRSSTGRSSSSRGWTLSIVVILLTISGLAGVLGYYLSGAAAGGDKRGGGGIHNGSGSQEAAAAAAAAGGDDFPGAQLDDFPGASSATSSSGAGAGASAAAATTAAPTGHPTAAPTTVPPTFALTSSLRPRLVSALAALTPLPSSPSSAESAFDPTTPRGRAVDWMLDYLSQENMEWVLNLQQPPQQQQPTAGGNEEEEGGGQTLLYLPLLPVELRQRYAMGLLYHEGGPHLGWEGQDRESNGHGHGHGNDIDHPNGADDSKQQQPDHSYCTWRGIACTTTTTATATSTSNLVTEIDWEGIHYRGTLPPEIGLLSATLRRLGMGTNRLTGTLPSALGSLGQLRYLNLAGNLLSGTIPSPLLGGSMPRLETLQLHSNRLTGAIPSDGLGQTTSLQFLDVSANRLSGPLPSSLGAMPALEWLCASSNRLAGPIPSTIGTLDRLEWLDLTDNALSGTLPPQMQDCPIKWLELGRNRLGGTIPPWLGSMGALQTLQIDDNLLTGEVPDELAGLRDLSRLKVTGNPGVMPWTTLPCCFDSLEVSDLDVAREVGDGNPANDVDGRLPVYQAGIPSDFVGSAPAYRPGHLTKIKNGIHLSEGLDVEVVAYSDQPVRLADGTETAEVFHGRPDAGHAFASPSGDGSWVYVSNSEAISDGGVGALYFDAQHRVTGYKRILSGTERNCGGGATPWGTWISCEEPWRRYNFRKGQVFEVDPWGDEGNGRRTVLGGEGGQYESFAYDVRDRSNPSFFYTEDHEEGPVRRFRPNPDQINWEDPTNMLHGDGTIDYLVLLNDGRFYWSTNKADGANTASRYFPNTEGVDCKDGHVYFVTKLNKQMYHLDLDAGTWTRATTQRGKFDGEPDQIARILGDANEILYMTEEEDGSMPGIHGRDRNGNSFTVLESPLYVEESTGVAFSPDGKSLLVAYQKNGILLRAWRRDGKSFSGAVIDIKYHTYG